MSSVPDNNIIILKEQLEKLYEGKNIKAHNVLQLTRQAMVIAADFKHLSGSEKKELVMDTINIMIDDIASAIGSEEDSSEIELLKFIVGDVAPAVIDDLFSAFKGDFTFKRSKRKFCPCI